LTVLDKKLAKLQNVHVSAVEKNGHVVFLHKIQEGPTDKSYGIHVAKLANLPEEVIKRAEEILNDLENGNQNGQTLLGEGNSQKTKNERIHENEIFNETPAQLSFFDEPEPMKDSSLSSKEKKVVKEIQSLNLLEMTPLDAMNALYQLQKKLK